MTYKKVKFNKERFSRKSALNYAKTPQFSVCQSSIFVNEDNSSKPISVLDKSSQPSSLIRLPREKKIHSTSIAIKWAAQSGFLSEILNTRTSSKKERKKKLVTIMKFSYTRH